MSSFSHAFRRYHGRQVDVLPVVDDVTFTVDAGELVSMIGPSGCGKTTMLRVLAGLIRPEDPGASVEVMGRPVDGPHPELGYVFQHGALIPWRTVRGNVEFALEVRRHRRLSRDDRSRVEEVLELVGLRGFEDYHPNRLSGGMRQRVGIARALVTDPALLLLDEPFGALDAQSRRLLQDELLRWRDARGFSAVLVTHDLDEAIYLSDRILVMSARPAHVLEVETVPFPPGSDRHDLRTTPEYASLQKRLWDLLVVENQRLQSTEERR